jgi:hypothetical protein
MIDAQGQSIPRWFICGTTLATVEQGRQESIADDIRPRLIDRDDGDG